MSATVSDLPSKEVADGDFEQAVATCLTQGGGPALIVDPASGMNAFHVGTGPATGLNYGSTFSNSISPAALASVHRTLERFAPSFEISDHGYATELEKLRLRLRDCYRLPHSVDIVFATSFQDLDYVALALSRRAGSEGISCIVTGLEEAEPGRELSAAGRFWTAEMASGRRVEQGDAVDPQLADSISLAVVPLRDSAGEPIPGDDVFLAVAAEIEGALKQGQSPCVHLLHGSVSGLVALSLSQIDALRRRFGHSMTLIVDAAQARIGRDQIAAYLSRGVSVLLSGSTFIGGPPCSAFALVPASARKEIASIPPGLGLIFARQEFPVAWPGVAQLPDTTNLGLLARLSAAIFELEVFSSLEPGEMRRVVHQFNLAARQMMRALAFDRVAYDHARLPGEESVRPLELQTSILMDTSRRRLADDFIAARGLHLQLISAKLRGSRPVRLGSPIKCFKRPDGRFAGNLSLALSMPQIVELAAMETGALAERLEKDFQMITKRICELT